MPSSRFPLLKGGLPPASERRNVRERGNTGASGPLGLLAPSARIVGSNQRNHATDENGGPAGPSAPTNPHGDNANYVCEFPGCNRSFPTTRGRGVHHQRTHKEWYDSRLKTASEKARWSKEECAMLAKKEADLAFVSNPRFMNQELLRFFPQRSLEAIKGRRRRQEHKDMVQAFLGELRNPPGFAPEETEDLPENEFLDFVESLPVIRSDAYNGRELQDIATEARRQGREATLRRLALYLRGVFTPPPPRKIRQQEKAQQSNTKREARRKEYGMTQSIWKKDRHRCITRIIDQVDDAKQPSRNVMEPYWTTILTSGSNEAPTVGRAPTIEGLWKPVTVPDLKTARIARSSAAGPDGVSARLFRAIPTPILLRIYNLIMWCRRLPEDLMRSRTVFLPKKKNAREPADFRPITIPPVLVRGLHKILAKRMERLLDIDPRQRAFRSTDGCADNTLLLDTLLRAHRKEYRALYLASLDVSKAFDSITHAAIEATLKGLGIPSPMVEYLKEVYAGSSTRLEGGDWMSLYIHPARGVRQGDPLSPVIFNAVTHRILQKLPAEIGAQLGNTTINAAAFADDILLFAGTPRGLQELINTVADQLTECGMNINSAKSMTVAIKASPHTKKTAVDKNITFKCDGRPLPSLSRADEWRYLGVSFTPEGRTRCNPAQTLAPMLEALTRAPLKPQQRVFALRAMVVPKLYHQLALGAVTIGALNKTDRLLRNSLRRWLALPHDTPNAYFHAAVKDGGLGIPSLRWTAPVQRRGRLLAAKEALGLQGLDRYMDEELEKCRKRLTDQGTFLRNPEMIAIRWATKLYESVDGSALKESARTAHQHQWVADGSRMLSGKDYINCHRVRIGALPTKSRTTRGRPEDRKCRAGCLAQETLNHVLQHCHRTHEARIRRHDAVVAYITRNIRRGGYQVLHEPHYRTNKGLRKPDIVAILGRTAVVVDAQVVSEQTNLTDAHLRKTRYYSEPEIIGAIKQEHKVQEVITTSATLSWRGVWSANSATELRNLGFIKSQDVKIMTTRVLIGSLAAFRKFNTVTSVEHRNGIG